MATIKHLTMPNDRGETLGDDWCLAMLGQDVDNVTHYVTTDGVQASQTPDEFSAGPFADLIVHLVNMHRFRRRAEVKRRKIIFVESPYSGDVTRNLKYARRAMEHVIKSGHIPIVTHLLWTQVMDDTDPTQRALALKMCEALRFVCDEVWFFNDYGISDGMERAKDDIKGTPLDGGLKFLIGRNPDTEESS